jgi:hypothetical protein
MPFYNRALVSRNKNLSYHPYYGQAYLGHTPIYHKIGSIHKATLIAGQEEHGLCLLDGFPKSSRGEVNLPSMPLSRIVPKPVLQKRGTMVIVCEDVCTNKLARPNVGPQPIAKQIHLLQRRRTQRIEPEAFARVHDGQLPRHG